MRADFFGKDGDTTWNLQRLQVDCPEYQHFSLDIRDRPSILNLFSEQKFDLIIHAAAQPSHDLAASRPFDDFDVNAVGTLNLLESTRRACPEAVFCFLSTNKVYGDAPNELPLVELESRWDYANPQDYGGITETCRIDQSKRGIISTHLMSVLCCINFIHIPVAVKSIIWVVVEKTVFPSWRRSPRRNSF